jgi:ACS family glucarate transporter-like MFS transporter
MFILILTAGTLSDKILQQGKSKFMARGLLAIIGFVVFCIALFFALKTDNLVANVSWLSLCLGGIGISMGMSWAAATDLGRNFAGTVSGWMNMWGNIGALLSPLLAGFFADRIGWNNTLMLIMVPVVFAIIMWFFVKPDNSLVQDKSQ